MKPVENNKKAAEKICSFHHYVVINMFITFSSNAYEVS
jgi:hypothetical protein